MVMALGSSSIIGSELRSSRPSIETHLLALYNSFLWAETAAVTASRPLVWAGNDERCVLAGVCEGIVGVETWIAGVAEVETGVVTAAVDCECPDSKMTVVVPGTTPCPPTMTKAMDGCGVGSS